MITAIGTDLNRAKLELDAGNLVAIPTETVYGLAANALNPNAVLKIYETKGRPTFNPLIVHVHDVNQFHHFVNNVPEAVQLLAASFSPGPITFVLPKKSIIPDIVTGGGETVALRIPNHPLTLELLKLLNYPLAAPSANPFGYISPVNAVHVYEQLNEKIPYILDGGNCEVGIESTVISIKDDKPVILRLGGTTPEAIQKVCPEVEMMLNTSSNPQSPGQLKMHYAPLTDFMIGEIDKIIEQHPDKKIGVLSFCETYKSENVLKNEVLSPNADLREAAGNLFTSMRKLDAIGAELIVAELFPEEGLGLAINDRLRRAAAK